MTKVAFVKTDDRAVGVRKALALADFAPFAGKRVFLKPNYNSADPAPGSTHEDVLRTLVAALKEGDAAEIVLGDRSGMGSTRAAMEQLGVFDLGAELGFQVMVLDELDAEGWERIQVPGGHWRRGFAIARAVLEADYVVQACCLKTHRFGGHFTLSLKNSVGLVAKRLPGEVHDYMHELHLSRHQRRMIAEINTAYAPDLIVLDGVEAFVKGGPARGTLVQSGVVLAGTDRVAIDAIGVGLLRYHGTTAAVRRGPVFRQAQIARAVELGLGVASPDEIEIVTGDDESAAYAAEIMDLVRRA